MTPPPLQSLLLVHGAAAQLDFAAFKFLPIRLEDVGVWVGVGVGVVVVVGVAVVVVVSDGLKKIIWLLRTVTYPYVFICSY